MTTVFKPIAFAMVMLLPIPLQARIGETPAQIQQRFGTFGQVGPNGGRVYRLQDYKITVYFALGVSQMEIITKVPKDGRDVLSEIEGNKKLTDHEIQLLLVANASGFAWEESEHYRWKRSDGLVFASYEAYYYGDGDKGPRLVICSARFLNEIQNGKKREEAAKKAEEKLKVEEGLKGY